MTVVLRWITAGESHGPALVAVLEGMVAGVEITTKELAAELARRKLGHGRSPRMAFEADELEVIGGIRHGRTQGGPIAVRIGNTEWPKWETVMSADPVDPALIEGRARNAPLTRPRPGHADLAGMTKFGFDDARPVLERASARETAARVALGTVAKAFLAQALDVRRRVARRRDRRRRRAGRRPGAGTARPGAGRREPRPRVLRGHRRTDDGRDRRRARRRRHPRRGDRGHRLRPAGRARVLRAGRPQAGRPAGGGADGHPGDEGGRDRRRVPDGAPAWQRRARRDDPRRSGRGRGRGLSLDTTIHRSPPASSLRYGGSPTAPAASRAV